MQLLAGCRMLVQENACHRTPFDESHISAPALLPFASDEEVEETCLKTENDSGGERVNICFMLY